MTHTITLKTRLILIATLPLLILAGACGKTSTVAMTCSSTAAASSSTVGTLTVSCSGGTAPYTISNLLVGGVAPTVSGTTASFTASTALTLTVASTTTLTSASGTFTVTDSGSATTSSSSDPTTDGSQQTSSQSFSFSTTSSLTTSDCTIAADVSGPALNQTVTYTMTASSSWGTAPYTFSNFAPGGSYSLVQGLTYVSTTQYQAKAAYTVAGSLSPSVTVTDSTGLSGSCSTSITVSSSTSTTSSSLSCTPILSPSVVTRGYPVQATAQVTGNVGTVEIYNISYPTASGMTGYFSGYMNATLYFSVPGSYALTFTVMDLATNQTANCTATETVQ